MMSRKSDIYLRRLLRHVPDYEIEERSALNPNRFDTLVLSRLNKHVDSLRISRRPSSDRGTSVVSSVDGQSVSSEHNSSGRFSLEGDTMSFQVDHLATFPVKDPLNFLLPDDAIKQLRKLEQNNGVWTLRAQLLLQGKGDSACLVVKDTNGDEIERFPLSAIDRVAPYVNMNRRDIYNNVLFLIVQDDSADSGSFVQEIHIFQCLSNRANEVVRQIEAFKAGNYSSAGLLQTMPVPPTPTIERQRTLSKTTDNEFPTVSRTDQLQRILNLCFDDIEVFVGRLQQASEAYKQLEAKRRNRADVKYVGVLAKRAKPPSQSEFVDALQKVKLSLNIIAKLRAHLHNPNAMELVHFLFTPLTIIVEASGPASGQGQRGSSNQSRSLATTVWSPMLTRDAKNVLVHSLTSKETDLWVSLGEAWTMTRDTYKKPLPVYIPRFTDDFKPKLSTLAGLTELPDNYQDDSDEDSLHQDFGRLEISTEGRFAPGGPISAPPQTNGLRNYDDDALDDVKFNSPYPNQRQPNISKRNENQKRSSPRKVPSHDSRHRRQNSYDQYSSAASEPSSSYSPNERRAIYISSPQSGSAQNDDRNFADHLHSRDLPAYICIDDRPARHRKELSVYFNQIVELLATTEEQRVKDYWKVRDSAGHTGYVPYNIIEPFPKSRRRPHAASSDYRGKPNYDRYEPRDSYFDEDYESDREYPSKKPYHVLHGVVSKRLSYYETPRAVGPPPNSSAIYVMPNTSNVGLNDKRNSFGKPERARDSSQSFQSFSGTEETSRTYGDSRRSSMSENREIGINRRPKHSSMPPAVDDFIIENDTSSEQVKQWLIRSGFGRMAVEFFGMFNGWQLLLCTKEDFEKVLEPDEATRLDHKLSRMKRYGKRPAGPTSLMRALHHRRMTTDLSTVVQSSSDSQEPFQAESENHRKKNLIYMQHKNKRHGQNADYAREEPAPDYSRRKYFFDGQRAAPGPIQNSLMNSLRDFQKHYKTSQTHF